MGAYKDITGQRFEKLIAIKFSHRSKTNHYYWIFLCDCGKEKPILKFNVTHKAVKSCGECYKTVEPKQYHGMSGTQFYTAWAGMRARCRNKKTPQYKDYGGRGIEVCERWQKFENFRDDMLDSYFKHTDKHGDFNTSLDRNNVNGNYEPSNCRWATYMEQSKNKRANLST